VKVKVPENGKNVEIPYTPKDKTPEDKKVPSEPVDPEGNKIPTDKPFPKVDIPGDKHPGDEIEIPTKDLPDIPGYDKPDGDTVKVKVPENGKNVEIPYTPKDKTPEDKKGDEIEIPTKDLPDIPGYDKPKGKTVKVKVPENGKPIQIPYTPKAGVPSGKNTPNKNVPEAGKPATKNHDDKNLPNTGSDQQSVLTIAGFIALGLSLVAGFRKKKD